MTFTLETPGSLTDREDVHDIIAEFYTSQTARLRAAGGPHIPPELPIAGYRADLDKYLPPKGALVVARAGAGHLLGCGGMSDIGGGIAELKYLYVRPEARGTGLGRRLVEERIAIARRMGLTRICVDTLKISVEMHGLYESMGFTRVDAFPQSKSLRDIAALAPFMIFYERQI